MLKRQATPLRAMIRTTFKQEVVESQVEFIKWSAAIALSLLVCGVFELLAAKIYHPDISAAIEYAKTVSIIPYSPNTFAPEPLERFRFTWGVILLTLSLFASYFVFNRVVTAGHFGRSLTNAYTGAAVFTLVAVLAITYAGLVAPNPLATNAQNQHDAAAKTNWQFYFITTFVYEHPYWYAFLLFPLIAFFFLSPSKLFGDNPAELEKWMRRGVLVLSGVLILAIMRITAFVFPYTTENSWDLNAVYYSVIQVFRGHALLINDFTNTYGLYPHFLVPILKLTGLSVAAFTAIMSVLIGVSFAMVIVVLDWNVTNKLLVLLGFTTMVFNSYLFSKIVINFDPYYAMFPIRWFFPFLLLFWAAWYMRKPTRLRYFLFFVIFPIGILWNPEFGLLAFLVMIGFLAFREFKTPTGTLIARGIAEHVAFAVVGLVTVFAAYAVCIRLFYGGFPDFAKLFSTFQVFYVVGFNMLPMPSTFHPWMLIALVYVVGLLYAISAMIKRTVDDRSALVLLLVGLGIGTFSYYEGRSHNWNLSACSPPAFLLMTLYADDLYTQYRSARVHAVVFALLLFFLGFSVFQVVYDTDRIVELMSETNNKKQSEPWRAHVEKNAQFIREHTVPGERVFILTGNIYTSLYYDLSRTAAVINPGFGDLFLRSDYNRIVDSLKTNETAKVFVEPRAFTLYDQQIPEILTSSYGVRASNSDVTLLQKRKPAGN